jgi:3-oxoacyl-[acyl-carrier-protein] synthase-1
MDERNGLEIGMQTFIISNNIISPLGFSTQENFNKVSKGESGIRLINNKLLPSGSIYASKIDDKQIEDKGLSDTYTRFEKLCILSITDALNKTGINGSEKDTIFIMSTTKGNIELIQNARLVSVKDKVSLEHSAQIIASYFHAANKPVVVSNACISGVLAIIMAKRLLESGKYQNAIVVGADVLSDFVVSGFQSLMAMSDELCRPFDSARKGINLGEGAGTVVMTSNKALTDKNSIRVMGEGLTNDANHISGPSRTGQELADAVSKALNRSNIKANELSFISAHGTATMYNDEMESKAFDIAELNDIPLHSLKAYFGHTLGAAGVIESIMTIESLRNRVVLPSGNFNQSGVPKNLHINTKLTESDKHHALKTASGFGGCNAALVYSSL